MKNDISLIMTTAVNSSDPCLTIRNSGERVFQLHCSLVSWITSSRVDNIILCDNSAPDNDYAGIAALAQSYGKKFEALSFRGDSARVVTHGKGFGEGEIIRHALENSSLIKESGSFYKVTGRVFIENFDAICALEAGHEVVFDLSILPVKKIAWKLLAALPGAGTLLTNNGFGFVKTIFYKCSVAYYRRHLLHCHGEVDSRKHFLLENRMFLPIIRHGYRPFAIQPDYVGYCAGTGELYGTHDYPVEVKERAAELMRSQRIPSASGADR